MSEASVDATQNLISTWAVMAANFPKDAIDDARSMTRTLAEKAVDMVNHLIGCDDHPTCTDSDEGRDMARTLVVVALMSVAEEIRRLDQPMTLADELLMTGVLQP